jgi:DNA-binding transcriptional LysR family regulator
MMRDLNDLQFFVAVVTQRSFSAAARFLGVPKSRVSRRVALFEEHLGVRLVERSTRRLSVTEIGQLIFEHARASLVEAEAIEEMALRSRAEPRGLVRVSCPLGFTASIADSLPTLLLKNPLLRVQLVVTNRRVDLVEEGIDVSVRVREKLDTDADLVMKRIGVSRHVLVASPTLLTTMGTPVTPSDLSRYPLLHQQEQLGLSSWLLANGNNEQESVNVQSRLATGDFGVLVGAACAGVGIALLPEPNCGKELEAGSLVRVLPGWDVAGGILHLVFPSRRGMLPSVRAVIDFLADALRSHVESETTPGVHPVERSVRVSAPSRAASQTP